MRVESFLERSAARCPDKTALVCDGERLSYSRLEEQAEQLAQGLRDLGVTPGDRIAVCLDNSVEAVVAIFAILKADATFVPLSTAAKPEKLAFLLDDSGAVVLVTRGHKARGLCTALSTTSQLATLLLVGRDTHLPATALRVASWDDLLATPAVVPASKPPAARAWSDQDIAAIIYTSGSTGRPKGVVLSHANMAAAATSVTQYLESTADDVVASVLPLQFSYGLYQMLDAFLVGATVILEKSFAFPQVVLQHMAEERATGFAVVPTIAALLLDLDLSTYRLDRLRYLTNAGAALPAAHVAGLQRKFPHAKLFLMYGLTECKRVSYLEPDQVDARPQSVGKAMPGVEAWVADDHGRPLPPGEVGELLVRGANVMLGYWNLDDETRRVIEPGRGPGERVLHTGDLFRADQEGYLYFVGRRDDVIKCGAEKVSPTEVENVLYRLEGIDLAAVVGVPDPLLGSVVKAVVTLKDGARLSENDVRRHCARYLDDVMVPKLLEFRATMPRNDAGKIDKRRLVAPEDDG